MNCLLDGDRLSGVESLRVVLQDSGMAAALAAGLAGHAARLAGLGSLRVCLPGPGGCGQGPDVAALAQACRRRGLGLSIDFALGDDADAQAALAGRPGALSATLAAGRALREAGVAVRWLVGLCPASVYRLEALFSLARDEDLEAVLAPPSLLRPALVRPPRALSPDEERFARDFITYRLLEEEKASLPPARVSFYQALLAAPGGGVPPPPAARRKEAVLACDRDAAGPRWQLREEPWPSFDEAADWREAAPTGRFGESPLAAYAQRAAEIAGVLLEGCRGLLQWSAAQTRRRPPPPGDAPARRLPRVLVIGVYGGDHIGDTAIFGGVLWRIHRHYGTSRAILMSQRPAHTGHLTPMLDTPVEVRVEAYDQSRVRRLLPECDGVVFAGGPLMDLPKQLVKHLYTVSLARRLSKPFIIEGVGVGPFVLRPSRWTGRRLFRSAERITVRTKADAEHPLVRDLGPEVGRDPAFDYLETRGAALTRLAPHERDWIEKLLRDTAGRTLVGLNVRPTRPAYTVGVAAHERAARTRAVEAEFERQLADGLRRFHEAAAAPPCCIFFPMNAIQFGSSDLRSAYRIQRQLRGEVDFRVWEADPGIDAVIALLRRLDLVIAMRFHAAIYALAQGRPTIGIDYRIGKRDKVAALLSDFGQQDNCCRIDQLTAEWLFERLCALAGKTGSG